MAKDIGYACNVVGDAELAQQLEELEVAGCDQIIRDRLASGHAKERGGLEFALSALEPGDTLTVCQAYMLSPSIRETLDVVDLILNKGGSLRTLRYPDESLVYLCELKDRWKSH